MSYVIILAQVVLWSFYGLGGAITSPGVVQVTQQAAAIAGVKVQPTSYWDEWQAIVPAVAASKSKNIIFGYSCGVGSTGYVAGAVAPTKVYVVGIQGSIYCPPSALAKNVVAAQETYNPSFLMTLGLGWKWYSRTVPLKLIARYDFHPYADVDPAAQADVLTFIQAVAKGRL